MAFWREGSEGNSFMGRERTSGLCCPCTKASSEMLVVSIAPRLLVLQTYCRAVPRSPQCCLLMCWNCNAILHHSWVWESQISAESSEILVTRELLFAAQVTLGPRKLCGGWVPTLTTQGQADLWCFPQSRLLQGKKHNFPPFLLES